MLGELSAGKGPLTLHTRFRFNMSSENKDSIYHLYKKFKVYVKFEPKGINRKETKLTGGLLLSLFL